VQVVNDPWPWFGMLHGPEYSVAELVGNGTLSAEAAEVLRVGLQGGASLFVAAGPQGAGKSTLATAVLEFLPPEAQVYVTSGARDPLAVPTVGGPVYLLINELSWHMPLYLHGPAAQRAFVLLAQGVRMVGTVHATSIAGAVQAICAEAEVEPSAISAPMLIAVVHAARGADWTVERRLAEIGFLEPRAGEPPTVLTLASGQPLEVHADALSRLAGWLG